MPSITLRPAVAADVDAVLAFWRASAEDTNRSDTREGVQALLARDPEGLILVGDTRGIAGSLIAVGTDGVATFSRGVLGPPAASVSIHQDVRRVSLS